MSQNAIMSSKPDNTPANPASAEVLANELSCRLPLILLFLAGSVWLVFGSTLGLIASIKFHSPRFLADSAWLTYGRVWPASTNSLLYGFCIPAGLGVALWLFSRLGKMGLVHGWLAAVGAATWNLGVLVGISGIFAGDSTGYASLEIPGYAALFLGTGYALIALCGALTFHARTEKSLYVSQWFLLAALLWFPWIYSTAELLLVTWPVRGMVQSVLAWWYAHNLQFVWAWLLGLGTVYYFLPKLSGRELHSSHTALFTFWTLLLFGPWAAIPGSAPLPSWMPVISSAATVLGVTTLIAVGLSLFRTVEGKLRLMDGSSLLRFFTFGTLVLLITGVMQVAAGDALLGPILSLTWFTAAKNHLNLYGFLCIVLFGAVYHIYPRILGTELWKAGIAAHFWLSAVGVVLLALPMAAAGVVEGLLLRDPNLPFVNVMNSSLRFLRLSTLGDLLIFGANLVFLLNLGVITLRLACAQLKSAYLAASADLFKTQEIKL
jgi:cytochrome c oxidase cbb3-type subunit I